MVSCFFQQSDCGLARLVHVCLLQCLWWTSAVSRPSALSLCICLVCLSFWMRGKKGGEMLSEGLAPWSRGACHVCVCFLQACVQEPSLVVQYGKETLFYFVLTLLFDACCEGWGFEKILLRFALTSLVFVAATPGCRPGPGSILSINIYTFPGNALYRAFAATIKLWVTWQRQKRATPSPP